jgi:hypothetical protein
MERVREKFTKSIVLSIDIKDMRETTIVQLRDLMEKNRGNVPCYFSVRDDRSTRLFQSRRFSVEPSENFVEQVTRMLGPRSVQFRGEPSNHKSAASVAGRRGHETY